MDMKIVKILTLTALFVSSVMFGFLPVHCAWYFRKDCTTTSKRYDRIISCLSCLSAGVFLATSFLDLLPDTREVFGNIIHDGPFMKYPVAEFIMIVGLILMLTMERLVMTCKQETHDNVTTDNTTLTNSERSGLLSENENVIQTTYSSLQESVCPRNEPEHTHNDAASTSTFRSILLLAALSLHSVFEGLAVGLQKHLSDLLEIFVGIIIHKTLISFSLGMALAKGQMSYWASLRSILVFAFASPLGICIGLIITEIGNGSTSSIVEGVLQGLACGTFIYITLFEILQHELSSNDIPMLKIMFLFLGFLLMSCLFFIAMN